MTIQVCATDVALVGVPLWQTTLATPYLCLAECNAYSCTVFTYASGTGLCSIYTSVNAATPETGTDIYVPSAADSCASFTFAPTAAPTTAAPSASPTNVPTRRPTAVGETEEPSASPSASPTRVSSPFVQNVSRHVLL